MDTQKVYAHFYETCYDAGHKCALYESTDTSASDIRTRIDAFLADLDRSPVPYISGTSAVALTKSDVLHTIFSPLYQPQRDFPKLATTLAEALAGNFTGIYENLGNPKSIDSCGAKEPQTYTWSGDAQRAIACGDGLPTGNLTVEEFLEHFNHLKSDSPEFGGSWSSVRLGCAGWKVHPKYNFQGPWVTPEADASLVEGKPAAPVLLVSSRNDPVTPLRNAYEMSKGHPGSRVIVQENAGHGSLMSPGKCREELIRKYFQTGEVPDEHTVCEPDCKPFEDCPQLKVGQLTAMEQYHSRVPLEMY